MIIQKTNYKVVVTNLSKNRFEIKRISRNHTITTYANRKEVDNKVNLLTLPLNLLRKEVSYEL